MGFTWPLIGATAFLYLAFFAMFGVEIFQPEGLDDEPGGCGIFDFFCDSFDLISNLVELGSFGLFGDRAEIDPLFSTLLFLTVGMGWLIFIVTTIRGNSVS